MAFNLSPPDSLDAGVTDFLLGGSPFGSAGAPESPFAGKVNDGDSGSPSSSESSPSPSPSAQRGRKRAKPSSQKQIRMPIRKGGLQLWQFLYTLLEDPEHYSELIEWTDRRGDFEFRMLEPEALAAWWGYIKHRPNMSYERLSRSLRFYYDKGILRKMGGERFLYRFCVSPEVMYEHIGNSDNRPTLKSIPPLVQQRMSKYTKQNYFYPHCCQYGGYSPDMMDTFVPPSSTSCYNYAYPHPTPSTIPLAESISSWNLRTVGSRPRLYSSDPPRSTASLPSYEDHLARCNSFPLSLTDAGASCFSPDELYLIHAATEAQRRGSSSSGPSSETCSPSSSNEFDVDVVMQEILQLTDQYTQTREFNGGAYSAPPLCTEDQGNYATEASLLMVPSTDNTSIFTTASIPTNAAQSTSMLYTSAHSPQTATLWTDNTIY